MNAPQDSLGEIRTRQRDLWLVTSLALVALTGGLASSLPSVQAALWERWGWRIPAEVMYSVLGGLVLLLVIYLWWKGRQIRQLARRLSLQHGQTEGLRLRLQTVHCILEASSHLRMDHDAAEGLRSILEEVAVALHADRVVLYRVGHEDQRPERDAVFPSSTRAPATSLLDFEDLVADTVARSGETMVLPLGCDPREYGIPASTPGEGWRSMVAAPLVLEGRPRGVLVVRNPENLCEGLWSEHDFELLEIFASCAVGVLHNLRRFQESAAKLRAVEQALEEQNARMHEEIEVRTAATMTRLAYSLAHAVSGPVTAVRGFADALLTTPIDAQRAANARGGLKAEFLRLHDRLQDLVDFTATWASRYELIDLGELLQQALDKQARERATAGIRVELDRYEQLPRTVVDTPRMFLVLEALVRAGCRALGEAGTERTLAIRMLPYSGRIRTTFELRGAVGTPDFLELLGSDVGTPQLRQPGGLDLAIACTIVRNHQGEVNAEFEGDHDAVLTLDLPIRRDSPPAARRTFEILPTGGREPTAEAVLDHLLTVGEPDATCVRTDSPPSPVARSSATSPFPGRPGEPNIPWDEAQGLAPPPPASPSTRLSGKRSIEPLFGSSEMESALRLFDEPKT